MFFASKINPKDQPSDQNSGEFVQCSEIPPTMGTAFRAECRDSYIRFGNKELGPIAYLRSNNSAPKRPITDISKLKIMGQNFENLGSFVEVQRNGDVEKKVIVEKPESHKRTLALRIKKQDPDIIIAAEVKDIQTATEYAEKYLDGLYQPILVEGNDQRGIDVCFFIKKDLPFDIQVQSHKEIPTSQEEVIDPLFSRDLPVLLIRQPNALPKSQPLMVLAGVHYKAQMPDPVKDKKAQIRRAKQVTGTVKILQKLKETYPDSPIFLSGDFNNDVRDKKSEFKPFYENSFNDAMNIAKDSPPEEQRGTQYFFFEEKAPPGQQGTLSNEQLDVVFADTNGQKYILSAGIQRDVDEKGIERPKPQSPDEVNQRASDHDGVFAVIDFKMLFQNYSQFVTR